MTGTGHRLFTGRTPPVNLDLGSVEQNGSAVLLRYRAAA